MNNKFGKVICIVLCLIMCCAFSSACTKKEEKKSVTVDVLEINKHGNVKLTISFDGMKANGMELADIITVSFDDKAFDMPVGTSFSDVDTGSMICRFDVEDNEVMLCINNGSFAVESGLATKTTVEEAPGYRWDMNTTSRITLTLKEKNGYASEYQKRNLVRTNERSDYADLTDEEFANFRSIVATGLKKNVLYRSSSPLDSDIGRNTYVMAAMENAGIRTVLNVDDSESEMTAYPTYKDSYYGTCNVLCAEMDNNYTSDAFAARVKECVLFINKNDGPYLIHCKEGKDRTGVLCAILECYVGATYDEIAADYMQTYVNFYGVNEDSEIYKLLLNSNFIDNMEKVLNVSDLKSSDLAKAAKNYLKSTGLTESDLTTLKSKLSA